MKEISLTTGGFAVVDNEDYDNVSLHEWWMVDYNGYEYAATIIDKKTITLHRFIMGDVEGDIHHLNEDGLDCRRSNMEVLTRWQHFVRYNKREYTSESGIRGIHKKYNKWAAELCFLGNKVYLGSFDTSEQASMARNDAISRYITVL